MSQIAPVLSDALITSSSGVDIALAVAVGTGVVTVLLALAEVRFRVADHEKKIKDHDTAREADRKEYLAALEAAKHASEKDRNEIRGNVQALQLGQMEGKVLMTEVRSQLATQAEGQREQTKMLHELMSVMGRLAGRRQSDKDAA